MAKEMANTDKSLQRLNQKIISLEKELAELQQRDDQNKDLSMLFDISMELLESLEKKILFQKIVDQAANLAATDTSAIYLVKDDLLYLEATSPRLPDEFPDEFRKARLKNHPHIRKVIEKRTVLSLKDVTKVKLTSEEKLIVETRNLASLVYIPLFVQNRVEGVIILGTIERKRNFQKHEIDLFTSFSNITSLALENAYLFKNLIDTKEKAEESNRLKTAFLHNISHEIRTPLNAIIGFSGLLINDNISGNHRKEYAEIIIQSNNQLLSIIDDIISIAHIESGQIAISESPVALIPLLKNLHTLYTAKAKKKHLELIVEAPENQNLIILTDESKLISILTNLLDNAVKFTETGMVKLICKKHRSRVDFIVADSGIGISESEKNKVFERFYQADYGSGKIFGGMGLGLAICVAYAEALGGKISLESTLGKGSVFTLSLPYNSTAKKAGSSKTKQSDSIILTS
jgi:signal transduction histidine kinase